MQIFIDKGGRHTHKKLGGQFFISTFRSNKGGPKGANYPDEICTFKIQSTRYNVRKVKWVSDPCRPYYFRVFFYFLVVQPNLRSEKLANLTVTSHFSLAQPLVKNARTLTVKEMTKKVELKF